MAGGMRARLGEYARTHYKYVHQLVYERHHGPIPKGFHVHHINGDMFDNRPENLTIVEPPSHVRLHNDAYELRDGTWWKRCKGCKELKELAEFRKRLPRNRGGFLVAKCVVCERKGFREAKRVFYQLNRGRLSEQKKAYYQANREKIKNAVKTRYWAQKHHD